MSGQSKAFASSVGIHLVALILVLVAMRGAAPGRKMLVVDFSLIGQAPIAQPTQPSRGAVSEGPDAVGMHWPAPAKVVERNVSPSKEVATKPALQAQRVAATENQVPIAVPEPTFSSAPEPGMDVPGSFRSQRVSGLEAAGPGSGGGHGSAGSTSISGPEGGTEGAATMYVKAQFAAIRNAIIKKLSYPPIARRKGWTGTVKVSFVVSEDGCVDNIRVVATSGFEVLDRNAVETIRRCSPYPRPPCAAEMVMPITYRLD